jgi:hypothetical protein
MPQSPTTGLPNPDPKDLLYTITLILFALSLICERVANLIKLSHKDLRTKHTLKHLEKDRERKIMWMALACGWLVAGISGGDFFTLVHEGHLLNYFTDTEVKTSQVLQAILGCLITGVFISLGSKFWHDMLDIVLQISNLKRLQVDTATTTAQAAGTQQLASSMKVLEPKFLRDFPNSYVGFDFLSGPGMLTIKYASDKPFTPAQQTEICQALGSDQIHFRPTNIVI